MKVLLMGDASGYHAVLGRTLAAAGHEVTVASQGSRWMHTPRDISLARKGGKLGGALLQLRLDTVLRNRLRGYDVVQLADTSFIDLKPQRQLALARRLKRENGSLWICALGDSPLYLQTVTSADSPLRYTEWETPWGRSNFSPLKNWLTPGMLDYHRRLLDLTDGITTALYEYHVATERFYDPARLRYVGIPVEMPPPVETAPSAGRPLKILFASHAGREASKGTDRLLPMLLRLKSERPGQIDLVTPQNLPYAQFLHLLEGMDLVCDQLYSFTPATTALLAMSRGAVAITGGEEEYLRFIGEPFGGVTPIFNPDPNDMEGTYLRLLALVDNRKALEVKRGIARSFVERHNAADKVAARALEAWFSV